MANQQQVPDYDYLIAKARARLISQGKEVTALAIYKMLPVIRKEQIREQLNDRKSSDGS